MNPDFSKLKFQDSSNKELLLFYSEIEPTNTQFNMCQASFYSVE